MQLACRIALDALRHGGWQDAAAEAEGVWRHGQQWDPPVRVGRYVAALVMEANWDVGKHAGRAWDEKE